MGLINFCPVDRSRGTMQKTKFKKEYIDIIMNHVNNGDYVIDATLMTEMGICAGTFSKYLHTQPAFKEAHEKLRNSKIASIVDRLVSGQMRPQCARLLLDCFDGIYPESVKRELDRKDRELELRLAGDLTDTASELYINFVEKEAPDEEEE